MNLPAGTISGPPAPPGQQGDIKVTPHPDYVNPFWVPEWVLPPFVHWLVSFLGIVGGVVLGAGISLACSLSISDQAVVRTLAKSCVNENLNCSALGQTAGPGMAAVLSLAGVVFIGFHLIGIAKSSPGKKGPKKPPT